MSDSTAQTDPLSPVAHRLISLENYDRLVVGENSSSPQADLLSTTAPASLFASDIRSRPYAQLSLAALWLWNDGLDQAHRIVQLDAPRLRALPIRNDESKAFSLQQPHGVVKEEDDELIESTAAFWHAIIHRREGDFSNSRYWYRRCAEHPMLATLNKRVEDLTHVLPANRSIFRMTANGFNAEALVDFVEQVQADAPTSPNHRLAVEITKMEWRSLFDFCTRRATVLM